MIIDVHVHLGSDTIFDSNRSEDQILAAMNRAGINAAIVQPAQWNTYLELTKQGHDRIAVFARQNPGVIYGVCSVNPHFGREIYAAEVTRCVRDLGFVGIKIVPHTHAWNPWTKIGTLPFDVAQELDVPILAHTASGIPFGLPSGFIPLAKRYPKVKLILSHAGSFFFEDEHLVVAQECPNVWLETSTREPNIENLRYFVKQIGAHRIMFGSDSPDEMEHNLWQHRHAGFSTEELDWLFHLTAREVFRLH